MSSVNCKLAIALLVWNSFSACANDYVAFPKHESYFRQTEQSHLVADAKPESRIEEKDLLQPPSLSKLASGEVPPPEPEELQNELAEVSQRWFYGHGIGQTITNVSTVVVFPPYAIYLLGNAGLKLAGFQPLYITNALPEEPRKKVLTFYENVTSVPGRVNSAFAGREFDTIEFDSNEQ